MTQKVGRAFQARKRRAPPRPSPAHPSAVGSSVRSEKACAKKCSQSPLRAPLEPAGTALLQSVPTDSAPGGRAPPLQANGSRQSKNEDEDEELGAANGHRPLKIPFLLPVLHGGFGDFVVGAGAAFGDPGGGDLGDDVVDACRRPIPTAPVQVTSPIVRKRMVRSSTASSSIGLGEAGFGIEPGPVAFEHFALVREIQARQRDRLAP